MLDYISDRMIKFCKDMILLYAVLNNLHSSTC